MKQIVKGMLLRSALFLFLLVLLSVFVFLFHPAQARAAPPATTEPSTDPASGSCSGSVWNPATGICWSCLFPVTLGAVPVMPGTHPDTPNPVIPVCHCGADPLKGWGTPLGYWSPSVLVDVTRTPYCMVNLGGILLPSVIGRGGGGVAQYSSDNHSFYQMHIYRLPSLASLPTFSSLLAWTHGGCGEAEHGVIGVEYLSELDPLWNDEKWGAVLNPELIPVLAGLMTSPAAVMAAEVADCVAATAHLPFDRIYWNAGCHGSLYPSTGSVAGHVDGTQASVLIAERGLVVLHRLGFLRDSDAQHLCGERASWRVPKSRYRIERVYPEGVPDCMTVGHSTSIGGGQSIFAGGLGLATAVSLSPEHYGYLIWKKRNCCAS